MNYRMLLFGMPLLFLLLLASLSEEETTVVLGSNVQSDPTSDNDSVVLSEPIDELLSLFNSVTEQFELTVQYGGPIGSFVTNEQYEQLANETLDKLQVTNDKASGLTVETSVTQLAEQRQAWLSIKLSMNDKQSTEELIRMLQHFNEKLLKLEVSPFWTYTAQGKLQDEADPVDYVISNWQAQQTGAYQHGGTTSNTYYAPLFSALTSYSTMSDERHPAAVQEARALDMTGNVQVAIHQHSETGASQLTVGIPAIHIEY